MKNGLVLLYLENSSMKCITNLLKTLFLCHEQNPLVYKAYFQKQTQFKADTVSFPSRGLDRFQQKRLCEPPKSYYDGENPEN